MTRAAALAVAVLVALPCFGGAPVYEFDGVNDYVSMGSAATLQEREFLTVSGWVNTSIPTAGRFFAARDDASNRDWAVIIGAAGSDVRFQVFIAGGSIRDVDSNTSIPANTWTHIAAVFQGSGTGRGMRIYIDGVKQADELAFGGDQLIDNDPADIEIGRRGDSAQYFSGGACCVRVHAASLGDAEIRGLYVAGGGRNTFGALSVVLPRANDESVVYTLDAPVLTANLNTGKVLAEDAVIASKDAARNYGLAKGGVTVGSATISTPAP